jgi:hypothetical protein
MDRPSVKKASPYMKSTKIIELLRYLLLLPADLCTVGRTLMRKEDPKDIKDSIALFPGNVTTCNAFSRGKTCPGALIP